MKRTFIGLKLTLVFLVLSGCTQSEPVSTLISPSATAPAPTLTPSPTATEAPAFLNGREIITAENASEIEELYRLGYGVVTELDISPDDSMLAVSSTTGLQVYDLETLQLVFALKDNWTNGIGWSPDSSKLVSAHYDGTLKLWDAFSGKIIQSIDAHENQANDASFSPNNEMIASLGQGITKLWKSDNLSLLAEYSWGSIVWSSDSKYLYFHHGGPILNVRDLETGQLLFFSQDDVFAPLGDDVIVHGRNPNAVVAVFQDGERSYVTGDGFSKGFFRAEGQAFLYNNGFDLVKYDITTKESEEIMQYDWYQFSRLMEWNSDLSIFISGSIYGDLVIIELESQEEVGSIGGYHCCFEKLAFAPDGDRVAISSDTSRKNLFVWDFDEQILQEGEPTFSELSYPPLEEGGEPLEFSQINDIGSLVWNHSEGLVISSDDVSARSVGVIGWDGLTGKTVYELRNDTDDESTFVGKTFLSPNGMNIAVRASRPTKLYIFDLTTGKELFGQEAESCTSFPVSWSGNSQTISFTQCKDEKHSVEVWAASEEEKLFEVFPPTQERYEYWFERVQSLALSFDGSLLAARNGFGDLWIWEIQTGDAIFDVSFDENPNSFRSVSWSPNDSLLAFDMPQGLILWDAETRQEVAVLSGFSGGLVDIAWSADGTQIATVGEDDTIRIWGIP